MFAKNTTRCLPIILFVALFSIFFVMLAPSSLVAIEFIDEEFNLDVNEVQLGFRLTKFRSNGKRFRFRRFFYETKERVVAYTVMVPVKEGDVIKMVPEQRTRTAVIAVPNVKDALLDTTANLETLDGKKLQHDDVAKRFAGRK